MGVFRDALKYYFGEDFDIEGHMPFYMCFFVKDDMWLVLTEHEPGSVGGGIGFTIDAKTGEISDYELDE